MAVELIRSFLQQASAQGTRSTALNPMGWLIAILISGIVSCSVWKVEPWITNLFAILVVIAVLIFFVVFVYFAFNNTDALRSEKFTLSKMAIEKSLVGDNIAGVFESGDRRTRIADQPHVLIEGGQSE